MTTTTLLPPAVTNGHRSTRVSNAYGFVDTQEIIKLLMEIGYDVVSSSQVRSRTGDPRSAKHLVRMREVGARPIVGDVFPEFVILNSHDGSSALRMLLGLFRLACANGHIVQDASFAEPVRMVHTHRNATQVLELARMMQQQAEHATTSIIRMRHQYMMRAEQEAFAYHAAELVKDRTVGRVEPSMLLAVRRTADMGNDLWTIFNVVQENIMRGGQVVHARAVNPLSRRRWQRVRPIQAIDATVQINTNLWKLATEFLNGEY